ncbi:MAG: hypothetical protein AAFZ07_15125 [Actinomycetota bacterium]
MQMEAQRGLSDIVAVLDEEIEHVDELHFRLVSLQRLLEAGDLELVDRAAAEVEVELFRVRETELVRSILVSTAIDQLGGQPQHTRLDDLIDLADDDHAARLRSQGRHLARRADQIERLGARTQRLADRQADELEAGGAFGDEEER